MGLVFIQRIADSDGVLAAAYRAIKFGAGFVVTPHPGESLAGAQGGDGQITDYHEITPAGGSGLLVQSLAYPMPVEIDSDFESPSDGTYQFIWGGAITIGGTGNNLLRVRAEVSGYTDSASFGATIQLYNLTTTTSLVERPFPPSSSASVHSSSTVPIAYQAPSGLTPGEYVIQVRAQIITAGIGSAHLLVQPFETGAGRTGGLMILEELAG